MRSTLNILQNIRTTSFLVHQSSLGWYGSTMLSEQAFSKHMYSTEGLRPSSSPVETEGTLAITEACVKKLKELQESASAPTSLRITVAAGGCSGYEYEFEMSQKEPDDLVFLQDGIEVLTDSESWKFIKNSTLDYDKKLIKRAFVIRANPNAAGGCGCGVSFQPVT